MALALVLVFTMAASAHETWLAARLPSVSVGQMVHLDVTSGMSFPELDYAIRPERVNVASFRLAGKCLLTGADLLPSTNTNVEWESDFTTLTIQTLPASGIRTRKLKN